MLLECISPKLILLCYRSNKFIMIIAINELIILINFTIIVIIKLNLCVNISFDRCARELEVLRLIRYR